MRECLHKCDKVGNKSPKEDQENYNSKVGEIILVKDLYLEPGQTKLTKVDLASDKTLSLSVLKLISPNEVILAENMCDFAEELWGSEPLTNVLLQLLTGETTP